MGDRRPSRRRSNRARSGGAGWASGTSSGGCGGWRSVKQHWLLPSGKNNECKVTTAGCATACVWCRQYQKRHKHDR
jgi:hypothetical protein